VGIMLIPFIGGFVNITLVLTLIFLVRDFFFEGRGIGKNFMGLQVVDRASGLPPTLLQSVQRNIVLIAPCLVSQVIALALRLVPIPFVDHFVKEIVNIVGMIYVVIVLTAVQTACLSATKSPAPTSSNPAWISASPFREPSASRL
jgi:hypothetical protein